MSEAIDIVDTLDHDCDSEKSIKIYIETPKSVGRRKIDQQTINAYLTNQLELMRKELARNSKPVGPVIAVRISESDED